MEYLDIRNTLGFLAECACALVHFVTWKGIYNLLICSWEVMSIYNETLVHGVCRSVGGGNSAITNL